MIADHLSTQCGISNNPLGFLATRFQTPVQGLTQAQIFPIKQCSIYRSIQKNVHIVSGKRLVRGSLDPISPNMISQMTSVRLAMLVTFLRRWLRNSGSRRLSFSSLVENILNTIRCGSIVTMTIEKMTAKQPLKM